MVARRLNPLRHGLEPAAAALALTALAMAVFSPLLVLSGVIVLVLGARIYYNHSGLGDRWNEWHEETPLGLGGLGPDAHMLLTGVLVGVLGACLVGAGAASAATAIA